MIALYAILGAILRRIYGGGLGIKKIYALVPMTILAGWLSYLAGGWWLCGIVAILSVPFWTMGHGSYMDMGTVDKPDNERFRYILIYLFGEETKPSLFRDMAGMTIRYTVPVALIAFAYVVAGVSDGWWLLAVGPAIAVAYALFAKLRHKLPVCSFVDGFTAYGELAAGAIFYGALAILSVNVS